MFPPAVDICSAHGSDSHPAEWWKQRVCSLFPQTAGRNIAGQTSANTRRHKFMQIKRKTSFLTLYSLLLLQDSLSKFVGLTLKDCGEDLLVEISEILFNELAFFRLMQDLDNSSSIALAAKHKNKKKPEQPSKAKCSLKVSCLFCSLFVFLVT